MLNIKSILKHKILRCKPLYARQTSLPSNLFIPTKPIYLLNLFTRQHVAGVDASKYWVLGWCPNPAADVPIPPAPRQPVQHDQGVQPRNQGTGCTETWHVKKFWPELGQESSLTMIKTILMCKIVLLLSSVLAKKLFLTID